MASVSSEPEVFFVRTKSGESCKHIFDNAFQACQAAEMGPKLLTEDMCLKLKASVDGHIFIMDSFESPAFTHLLSLSCRIYGAPCLLHCLERSENLPKGPTPVFAMCMRGAVVTVTGFENSIRNAIEEKLTWMNGRFTKALTKSTTHCVAKETSSNKYQTAAQLKMPLLTAKWIDESYTESKARCFAATDSIWLSKFKCPIFLGCTVTTSNLKDKEKIRQIVEQGGGVYTGQMTYQECTHLILDQPQGQKYQFARKWGSVFIVKPQWVYDCVAADYHVAENNSLYSLSCDSSTPEKAELPLPHLPDVSAIGLANVTTCQVDQTVSTAAGRRSAGDNSLDYTDYMCASDILKGLKICLRNLDEATTVSLTKQIVSLGGSRTESVTNASYVVVPSTASNIGQHMSNIRAPIVCMDWLKQVVQTHRLVDCGPFLIASGIGSRVAAPSKPEICNPTYERATSAACRETTVPGVPEARDTSMDVEAMPSDILSQYGSSVMHITDGNTSNRKACESGNRLFGGLTFVLCNMTRPDTERLRSLIMNHGGVVTSTRECVNYAVFPTLIRPDQVLDHVACTHRVSAAWLQACDSKRVLLSPDSDMLYTPIAVKSPCTLAGTVVTTTKLSAGERECAAKLVQLMGGCYSDEMRRFATKTIPATTHLVCQLTDSAKYTAAVEWSLKVVTLRWVIDCAKSGKILGESPYHPSKAQLSTDPASDCASAKQLAGCVEENAITDPALSPARVTQVVHSRVKALRSDCKPLTVSKAPSTPVHQFLSPSLLDNPNASFHAKFDLAGNAMDTPHSAGRRSVASVTPLDEALNKHLSIALAKHYVNTPQGKSPVLKHHEVEMPSGGNTEHSMSDCLNVLQQIRTYMRTKADDSDKNQRWTVTAPKAPAPTSGHPAGPSGNTKSVPAKEESQSQAGLVTWDDQTSRCEKNRLVANTAVELEELAQMMTGDFTQENNLSSDIKEPDVDISLKDSFSKSTMDERKPAPVFQLSGFANEERDQLASILEKLDMEVAISSNFDRRCTHVILSRPNRNEKFLSAIVTGIWLLHKSYLTECGKAGHLIDEVPYEWGGPGTGDFLPKEDQTLAIYARAAHKWRVKVQQAKKKGEPWQAFSDWRVILCLGDDRLSSMRRILECGGATILSTGPDITEHENVTHAFLDVRKGTLNAHMLLSLIKAGVACLKPDFIPSYLMDEVVPTLQDPRFSLSAIVNRSPNAVASVRKRTQDESSTPSSKRLRS